MAWANGVINRISDVVYKIFDNNSNKVRRVNFNLLKKAKVRRDKEEGVAKSAEEISSENELFYYAIAPAAQLLRAEQQPEMSANAQPNETGKVSEPEALEDAGQAEIRDEVQPAAAPATPPVSPQGQKPVLPATSSSRSLQSIRPTA